MRLLTFTELQQKKGIPYCRDHLRRKVNAGEFPKPVPLGRGSRRIGWIEEEIDAHLEELVMERDAGTGELDPEHPSAAPTAAPAQAERSIAHRRRATARPPRSRGGRRAN